MQNQDGMGRNAAKRMVARPGLLNRVKVPCWKFRAENAVTSIQLFPNLSGEVDWVANIDEEDEIELQ